MIDKLLVYDLITNQVICVGNSDDIEKAIGLNNEHTYYYWKSGKEYLGRYLIYRSGFKEKREMKFAIKDTYDKDKVIYKGNKQDTANYLDLSEGYVMSASHYGILVKKQYRIERI